MSCDFLRAPRCRGAIAGSALVTRPPGAISDPDTGRLHRERQFRVHPTSLPKSARSDRPSYASPSARRRRSAAHRVNATVHHLPLAGSASFPASLWCLQATTPGRIPSLTHALTTSCGAVCTRPASAVSSRGRRVARVQPERIAVRDLVDPLALAARGKCTGRRVEMIGICVGGRRDDEFGSCRSRAPRFAPAHCASGSIRIERPLASEARTTPRPVDATGRRPAASWRRRHRDDVDGARLCAAVDAAERLTDVSTSWRPAPALVTRRRPADLERAAAAHNSRGVMPSDALCSGAPARVLEDVRSTRRCPLRAGTPRLDVAADAGSPADRYIQSARSNSFLHTPPGVVDHARVGDDCRPLGYARSTVAQPDPLRVVRLVGVDVVAPEGCPSSAVVGKYASAPVGVSATCRPMRDSSCKHLDHESLRVGPTGL